MHSPGSQLDCRHVDEARVDVFGGPAVRAAGVWRTIQGPCGFRSDDGRRRAFQHGGVERRQRAGCRWVRRRQRRLGSTCRRYKRLRRSSDGRVERSEWRRLGSRRITWGCGWRGTEWIERCRPWRSERSGRRELRGKWWRRRRCGLSIERAERRRAVLNRQHGGSLSAGQLHVR